MSDSTPFASPNFAPNDDDLDDDAMDDANIQVDTNVAPDEDLDDDLDDDLGNVVEGGTARAVLEFTAKSIVDDPEAVVVEVDRAKSGVKLSLHVAPSDMGRIIGKRGRVAQALRTVVRAAAARDGDDAAVDIVD
jgi:hypothetical protein